LLDWTGHVRALLRDGVGLAGGYVLTPAATAQFNNAIGPVHAVNPWTVRTFRSGVEPDNVADGRRHKVLSLERIIADSTHRLARMLGRQAREAALETPLPTFATRVNREFAERINADLVASLDAAAATIEPARLATHLADPDVNQSILAPSGQDTSTPVSDQPTETGPPPGADDAGLLPALELADAEQP
jgi:hypothetical protein